ARASCVVTSIDRPTFADRRSIRIVDCRLEDYNRDQSSMPCERCDDTGWAAITVDGVRRVVRCECWREGLSARALDDARIPPRYRRCDLDTFVIYPNENLARAVRLAKSFAEQFPVQPKGLCLIGPPGIGKTHLAVAVLRQVILTRGARGLFYDTRDLLRLIRST